MVLESKVNKLTLVARIGKAHGRSGTVRIIPINNSDEKILHLTKTYVVDNFGNIAEVELSNIRKYTCGRFLAKLNNCRNRTQVKQFEYKYILAP